MRHLKTYKLFENKSEEVSLFHQNLKDQVSDILLDIKDDGFEHIHAATPTHWKNGPLWESFEINIFKPKGEYDELEGLDTVLDFGYSEVKDSILHLISFMKTVGYRVNKTVIYRQGLFPPLVINGEVDIPNYEDITTIKLVFEE